MCLVFSCRASTGFALLLLVGFFVCWEGFLAADSGVSEYLQLFHPTLAPDGCKSGGHGPLNAVKHQGFVCFQCGGNGYAVCLCPPTEDCEEVDDVGAEI